MIFFIAHYELIETRPYVLVEILKLTLFTYQTAELLYVYRIVTYHFQKEPHMTLLGRC